MCQLKQLQNPIRSHFSHGPCAHTMSPEPTFSHPLVPLHPLCGFCAWPGSPPGGHQQAQANLPPAWQLSRKENTPSLKGAEEGQAPSNPGGMSVPEPISVAQRAPQAGRHTRATWSLLGAKRYSRPHLSPMDQNHGRETWGPVTQRGGIGAEQAKIAGVHHILYYYWPPTVLITTVIQYKPKSSTFCGHPPFSFHTETE